MSDEASARATRARELRHEALGLTSDRLLTMYRQMVLSRGIPFNVATISSSFLNSSMPTGRGTSMSGCAKPNVSGAFTHVT